MNYLLTQLDYNVARKYLRSMTQSKFGNFPYYEDCLVDGIQDGLLEAIPKYKIGKKSLAQFASIFMIRRFLDSFRREGNRTRRGKFKPISVELFPNDHLYDNKDIDFIDTMDIFKKALKDKDKNVKEVFGGRLYGFTLEEIASNMGMSVGRISQLLTDIKMAYTFQINKGIA